MDRIFDIEPNIVEAIVAQTPGNQKRTTHIVKRLCFPIGVFGARGCFRTRFSPILKWIWHGLCCFFWNYILIRRLTRLWHCFSELLFALSWHKICTPLHNPSAVTSFQRATAARSVFNLRAIIKYVECFALLFFSFFDLLTY